MWFNPIGDQQVSGRCVGLSLDTVEAHPVLGEGIDRVDIQSQVSLTTRPVSPTVHDLFLLTYLVLCESGGMFPRTRLLSATLPTSLAPVTFLKRGHLSPGPRKSKQSPCSCGEVRTIWPTASASGDLASQVFWPQVGYTVLIFIYFSGNFFWEQVRKASTRTFYLQSLACRNLVHDTDKGLSVCAFLFLFFLIFQERLNEA